MKIIGRENNQRVYKYIKKEYINNVENMKAYKVLIPQATGSGKFGENFSAPFVEPPQTGSTETFISIGNFDDLESANALRKYICTKFARTLLGVLKVTQMVISQCGGIFPSKISLINPTLTGLYP